MIQINQLNNKDKKVFINRFVISLALLFYWTLLFALALVSDSSISSQWNIPLGVEYRGIIAYLFIVMLTPFIYGAVYELNKLFFGSHCKKTFWLLFFGIITFTYLPNFTYITKIHYFNDIVIPKIPNSNELIDLFKTIFSLFTITIFVSILVLTFVIVYIAKNRGMINFTSLFLFVLLTVIVGFGFFSIGFIGLLKSWLVLFFVLSISALTDTFGYIGGILFGKNKISKVVSPKKTIEGFVIGLVSTILCGLFITYLISFGESSHNSFENLIHIKSVYDNVYTRWFFMVFLIILISLVSSLGDFAFSFIKRNYQIKDYGSLFQEHGGILDRFDSFLFSATFYVLWIFFLSGISDSFLFS